MSDYYQEFESFDNFIQSHTPDYGCQKLNLFKNDSFSCHVQEEFEIDFEQKSTLVLNGTDKHAPMDSKQTKKIKKVSKKERNQKDYKKNICRNILRHAIKSMYSCKDCIEFIEQLVDDSKAFKNYYNRTLEQITGFRVLRDHLIASEEESQCIRNRKLAFKHYLVWYLKNKATAMILKGETQHPTEYLKYKNEVLLYYVQMPQEWVSNSAEWLNEPSPPIYLQCQDITGSQHI